MPGGMPMTAGGMTIIYLFTMFCVTMLLLRYYTREYRTKPTPRTEVHFVLFEGQTILGVMDTQKGMYFCVGNDAMDEKNYE
jgi:hypothetical protein